MYKPVFDSLIALSNNVITTGIKKISETKEFCKVARLISISRVTRTVYVGLNKEKSVIYDDDAFKGLYSKKFVRNTRELKICYTFSGENDFDKMDTQTQQICELLVNILCMGYSTYYLLQAERQKEDTDQESGIPNARGFEHFFTDILHQDKLTEYAVIRSNIKGCNLLNNLYGYYCTSEIIARFAVVLNKLMEKDEICARSGGDNFTLMVKKSRLKKHLQEFVSMPVECYIGQEKVTLNISLRAGIVEINEDVFDSGTIIARAESCLEVAKRREGGDVVYYDRDVIRRELEQTLLESEMPAALSDNEFEVFFQPKVRVDNRTMIGAEALIRWRKNGRLIPPSDFIPIAERTGFIKKLDLFVLENTCRMLKKWQDAGMRIVPVSVNFSKMHLRFPHFADRIMKIVDKYELPPRYIEVEFTETAYIDDFNAIKEAISELKNHGVVVSMDDFGTGYSSLALLKDLNFDVLKLDKSLASNKTDERGMVVLENVLRMANELNMVTVCEGVEEEENVENLRSMGCNIIQGFYFDKPLPETEFEERLLNPIYAKSLQFE